jgi:hypothetical protein
MKQVMLQPLCISASEVKQLLRIENTHLKRLVNAGRLRKAKGLPNRYLWSSVLDIAGDPTLINKRGIYAA